MAAHKNNRNVTRQLIITKARSLFAQYGKSNVTMGQIADECGKKRRTLYTYFSTKDEIYLAVIENELSTLIDRLQRVMDRTMPAEKKMEEYIYIRFDAIKECIERNGSLKADFFRNIYEVEKARRPIDLLEIRMLRQIVSQGVEENTFHVADPQWVAMILFYCLKGLEAPYLNNNIASYLRNHRRQIMQILCYGIENEQHQE